MIRASFCTLRSGLTFLERSLPLRGKMLRRTESGLTLIEAIIAWALALVVLLGALALFTALRKFALRSELASDAEQRLRLALDSMAHDLSRAGLGVDPDGTPGRPDEAIEGAWAGAVVMRGDYDAEDVSARSDPELWIAGHFPMTRTGNDEIVAYALRSGTGSGGSDLVFDADLTSPTPVLTSSGDSVAPRDGLTESVTLSRVLTPGGGPAPLGAILYRATLSNNAATWGTGNAVNWQPLADGIGSLDLRYFDDAGSQVPAPGGSESARAQRGRIAALEIRVVSLERTPDPAWSEPGDPDPVMRHYRRAESILRIAVRNASSFTMRDDQG